MYISYIYIYIYIYIGEDGGQLYENLHSGALKREKRNKNMANVETKCKNN